MNLKTMGFLQMRYWVSSFLLFGLLAAAGGAELMAQHDEPTLRRFDRRADSEFQLFGDRDYARGGLRLAGLYGAEWVNDGDIGWDWWWTKASPPVDLPSFFEMPFYFAAPPSEWNKHRAVVSSLNNALGGGYTVNANNAIGQFEGEILPHDGILGPQHAGAASTSDRTCLDFTLDNVASGNPLVASSDCEITWGNAGWQGSRNVTEEGWLNHLNSVGSANFSFDAWKVDPTLQDQSKFLGAFQAYSFFSDYSSEALFGSSQYPAYGNVVPGGQGPPARTGWPLGLLAKVEAFSWPAPRMLSTGWFQITVTNNSAEVYNVPLDYDSLYMGFHIGWFHYEQGSSVYRDPKNSTLRAATMCQGFTGPNGCGPLDRDPQHTSSAWGSRVPNGIGAGFNYGASAIVFLKSPIGDLRNKLFTDPTSQFFMAGDPDQWDDTITINHGHMCGFHSCSRVIWRAPSGNPDYEQRQFGMVASITNDVLGTRDLFTGFDDHIAWDTWRWEEYPDRNQLDFNRYTPGNWDYNDDGVDDVLSYDDCSDQGGLQFDPFTGGEKRCSVSWSDSLTSGWSNVYQNVGSVAGVGPFRLAAGDTVQFIAAIVMPNNLGPPALGEIENGIAEVVAHYQRFSLLPEPAPAPAIVSVGVQHGGLRPGLDPETAPKAGLDLVWDDTPDAYEDAFIAKLAASLETATPGTPDYRLRELNPFLVDTLKWLAQNNVAFIHIYKSCDGGSTFTDDGDCFADPAAGGKFQEAGGWLPYATLEPDENGVFPRSFRDDFVFGGRSYLYSMVAETRGISVPIQTGDDIATVGGQVICTLNCSSTVLEIPTLLPVFSTSIDNPFVVQPYIPISQQAGSARSTVTLAAGGGSPDFIPFSRMGVATAQDEVADGTYRLLFGDAIVVTETAVESEGAFVVQNTSVEVTADGTVTTYTAPGRVAVDKPFSETIVGSTRTRVYTFDALSAVLVNDSDEPYTVTDQLEGGQSVPGSYFALPNYPQFVFSIDNSAGGDFEEQFYLDAADERIVPLVEPSVTYRSNLVSGATGEGRYSITWLDKAFGAASPFTLNVLDPEGARAAVLSSLQSRAGQTSATGAAVATAIGVAETDLLAVELPFSIQNITDSDNPSNVSVAVLASDKLPTLLLGTGLDTLLVEVPENVWLPGDGLVLLEDDAVTFGRIVLGCDPNTWVRLQCNPLAVGSPGVTGYIANGANQELRFSYVQTITSATGYTFDLTSARRGLELATEADILASLDSVKVVPNPFIMFSQYSTSGGTDRIIFTHVPPSGTLRIFSVTGQFIQELSWDESDLNGRGDLFFSLRTREGNEMAAGLYLYVLTATDEGGGEIGVTKGKFVLIK